MAAVTEDGHVERRSLVWEGTGGLGVGKEMSALHLGLERVQ